MTSRRLADWLRRPGSRVAVVGASGWIGMALVERLLAAGAEASQLRLLGSSHRRIDIAGRTLQVAPLEGARLQDGDWLVLHAAIVGADRLDGDWARTRAANDAILEQALALADGARLVFFSSGAVHRQGFGGPAKQAYAAMKAAHEAEVLVRRPALVPRVFNLGGPYINHVDAYALGDFIVSAARHRRIRIGASGPVFRSFTHVLEMAEAVLDLALAPDGPPPPFDVAGGEVVELGALAAMVGRVLGPDGLAIERPERLDAAADWYVGDGRLYQEALFRAGLQPIGLEQIVADTAAYLGVVKRS